MDDLLIISKTRWQLRRAITTMNQWFEMASLEQHPDKTYIGRIAHGFDWLGYQFNETGLIAVSARSLTNYNNKLRQLYEQALRLHLDSDQTHTRVMDYQSRWQR